jgi:spore germination cell wall hydrolase CwlJ-like protein
MSGLIPFGFGYHKASKKGNAVLMTEHAIELTDLSAATDGGSPRNPRRLRFRRNSALYFIVLVAVTAIFAAIVAIYQMSGLDEENSAAGEQALTVPAAMAGYTPPVIEPETFLDIPPQRAQEINAAMPFAQIANPAAPPFRFSGSLVDHERALDCLASAAFYEAGNNVTGQQSVVQVVLNRVRHPAFPKTVCGVIFQGSERRTGCQFSYTCDGAFARIPSAENWRRARITARLALSGNVFAPVGHATHYHTDWVVPTWSPKMDKVTKVLTHLFFRWKGRWGRPVAFLSNSGGVEPVIPKLAHLSWAHKEGAVAPAEVTEESAMPGNPVPETLPPPISEAVKNLPPGILQKNSIRASSVQDNSFILLLDPGAFPGSYAVVAYNICRRQAPGPCHVMGWIDAASMPASVATSGSSRATMSFEYRRDPARKTESALWNCNQIKRDIASQCMNIPQATTKSEVPPVAAAAK